MARAPDAEVTFTDCDGDTLRLTAERQGTRGRVSLFHNGTFFAGGFITKIAFTTIDKKLYVNGHEAVIQLKAGDDAVVDKIEAVCDAGLAVFSRGESIDAAAELAKVKQMNIEKAIEAMESEGVSKELIDKARAKQAKDLSQKKKIPEESLTNLLEMGIPKNRAIRGLALGDGTTVETALSWLEKHQEDPSVDLPLEEYLMPVFVKALTEEEKKAKAKEIQDLLEAKKAAKVEEEREYQRKLEKTRRKDGKEKAEWKEEYEKKKRLEAYEERKKEKERDRVAKEELRKKIAEERAAKGWSEQPHEEEVKSKEEPRMSAKEFFESQNRPAAPAADDDWDPMRLNKAFSEPAPTPTTPQPLPPHDGLPLPGRDLTETDLSKAVLKVSHLPSTLKILTAYVSNMVSDPFNAKYRTIKTTNNAFAKNIAAHPDAVVVLYLLGFRPQSEALNISSIHLPTAAALLKTLESAGK
eukprot:TRINITY_DN2096_c0_g2_i1.p1 TRINITY_DN2096_c0_g2~~TRINITY_DN2096_c0_g2_i1.p1  ORF type:complete len:484 (+),score=172.96 TRINITY_DN2096_c0_g2_i1:49-1452(+)